MPDSIIHLELLLAFLAAITQFFLISLLYLDGRDRWPNWVYKIPLVLVVVAAVMSLIAINDRSWRPEHAVWFWSCETIAIYGMIFRGVFHRMPKKDYDSLRECAAWIGGMALIPFVFYLIL